MDHGSESEGNSRFIWGCLENSVDVKVGPLEARRCGTWVPVARCRCCGIVGEVVEVDHGIPGDNMCELRCDILNGSSLEVFGFMIKFEVVSWVIRMWGLECGR